MQRIVRLFFMIVGVALVFFGAYMVVASFFGEDSPVFAGILALAVGLLNIVVSVFLRRIS